MAKTVEPADRQVAGGRTTSLRYRVRVLPERHELEVSLDIVGVVASADGCLRVVSPTWVPGDYTFETFGRDVGGVRAVDLETGAARSLRRDGWQGYRIAAEGGDVRVTYTAYCSSVDFSEECGVLDDRYAALLGTRYLYVPGHAGPCTVEYEVPDGWAIHHPSGATRTAPSTWEYPSYEVLVDTPVVMGAYDLFTRDVEGTTFSFVFLTRAVGFSSQVGPFIDRVALAAASFHRIFGSFPFEAYTFVLSADPNADWGLEHLTSTMVGLDPNVFVDPEQNATGIRACAHELFHAWNVRRLRPAPLGDLDYARGGFSEGLWVAEGFTRYYEFLTLTRIGVYTPEQFFSAVVNYYRHLACMPAYQRVSAIDSSAASYLNHEDYPGRDNNSIDYYAKGMLIAFELDVALRTGASGSSLDVAFRGFYERFVGRGAGYTPADVFAFFEEVQPGLAAQLRREATEPRALSIVETLERLGFLVAEETVPTIGLVLEGDTGPGVYGVLDTSPAGQSGIAPEDEITSVDGFPFSLVALEWVIANQREVTLGVMRGHQSRTYTIPTGSRAQIGALTWNGDEGQRARIAAWLERPFTVARGEGVDLDFYENFHGIETVL